MANKAKYRIGGSIGDFELDLESTLTLQVVANLIPDAYCEVCKRTSREAENLPRVLQFSTK